MRLTVCAIVISLMAGCGSAQQPPLVVSNIDVTSASNTMSAAYFDLHNNSKDTIVVTHVSSPQFEHVAMHETVIENDIARMRRLDSASVPAGETLRFMRGGRHLMLSKPIGSPTTVTFNFYHDGQQLLSVSTSLEP